ncbi:Tc toxin subunit A [Yersinia enterocolitica]|uniref:Tc toxin subunit A n=1 Tax=Yersinia enterocolitica TaxID=630 RepID=UPI003F45304C
MSDTVSIKYISPDQDGLIRVLQASGFHTIFDITALSQQTFSEHCAPLTIDQAEDIYQQATERANNLQALYRAWLLHRDPINQSIDKLSANAAIEHLNDAVSRNLGGDANFEDLFPERSEEGYVDVTSIQSLFSPGRYLTALYKVALKLHDEDNELHIDKRRPDLKSLILSQRNMDTEVTSLDILLNVLQHNDDNSVLANLADTYHPMTLPYDDAQQQINSALVAKGTNLNNLWSRLLDNQLDCFSAYSHNMSPLSVQPRVRTTETLTSQQTFYLRSNNKTLYLTDLFVVSGHQNASALIAIGNPNISGSAPAEFYFFYYPGNATTGAGAGYYLGIKNITIQDRQMNNCFLTSNSGQSNNLQGDFVQFSANQDRGFSAGYHLPLEITPMHSDATDIYLNVVGKGYIASGPLPWTTNERLTLIATKDNALSFSLHNQAIGGDKLDLKEILPGRADRTPTPPVREALSLTPNSFQLLTNDLPTTTNIITHYGLSLNPQQTSDAALAAALNKTEQFCRSTGLSFNRLIELTAQRDHQSTGAQLSESTFIKAGSTKFVPVNEYGATYLTGSESTPLLVNPELQLNLNESNVVSLAGRAEKLVRLAHTTELTFEQLDWLISNASAAVAEHGRDTILDSQTLSALADYLRLQQRYDLSVDAFTAFIGAVNPYARQGESSFYQQLFSHPDGSSSLPLGAVVNFEADTASENQALICGALGVTADELSRIAGYCFDTQKNSQKLDEFALGQLYRVAMIPRLLGISFAEAESLWFLMAGESQQFIQQIAGAAALDTLQRLADTELVIDWMNSHQLTVADLRSMITTTYSELATPELFNFLKNIYQSVDSQPLNRTTRLDDAIQSKLVRSLSSGFGLKANVLARMIDWLTQSTQGTSGAFSLESYWHKIEALFSAETPTLAMLEQQVDLLRWSQQLSQYALICQWGALTEQDIALLVDTPERLLSDATQVARPDLLLLLTLSRLKEWQQRVAVSADEAMRYFSLDENDTHDRLALLAEIHGWDKDQLKRVNDHLQGNNSVAPVSFSALYTLENWMRMSAQLTVGSRTLSNLKTMAQNKADAESPLLLAAVSQDLIASSRL